MTNVYISNYKEFLKKFYTKMTEYHAERERISEQYAPEFAKSALSDLDRKANRELKELKKKIREMHNQICELLSISSIPTVESLTADRLFFDGSAKVELTPEIVAVFVERYSENPTMLSLISKWIETKHKNDTNFIAVKSCICTPREKAKTYKEFADSALSLCGKIFSGDTSELEIASYADPTFSADLYTKIGSGLNLADYKNARVPEQAKHLLDDFKIVSGENPFDFHFKSVNQRTGSV
ncbi:hypothetical protein [Lachnoclostridium sp. MSJ-17]|uniref:hypothetical protein n=1 Tax=Lachnoclostridium sp. MSJ-17 TaxID=2841516 RepID=UPI001C10E665|nr:hypothetical protein [Lachnoclostridium sp. MSJ-17]MBU5461443.1 hypothetical protein [Lachnoclostridium sp. MSJ-17]